MTHTAAYIKEELLAPISDLFLKYGLRSTSMDDICIHLKISKKTLYQIFENKEDVVEQVMFYRLEKTRKEISLNELSWTNPIRFWYEMKEHIIRDLESRLPANFFDVKKYHPAVEEKTRQEQKRFLGSFLSGMLARGAELGYLRKDVDVSLQIYLLSRQMDFLQEEEMMNTMEYPVSRLISTILDNFILAISTQKGIEEYIKMGHEMKNGR